MEDIVEKHPTDVLIKAAALHASQSVVSVITHNVPGDMVRYGKIRLRGKDERKYVIWATGVIIECEVGVAEGTYLSTILAPATLFVRTNGVPPDDIEIDVYESGGKLFKGEVLACDFHYNLAAVRILSDSPMPTAIVRGLDDISSIDLPEHHQWCMENPFQLRPHSNLFKILPGTRIINLSRVYVPPCNLQVFSGVMRMSPPRTFGCKELFWIEDSDNYGNGGPVFNCSGEVIGISFRGFCFLPSNLVSRWWSHYKSSREFIRPWLGVEISNLHEACAVFLEQLVKKFPNIITGVVVTEVENNPSAYCSSLQPNDVILKCDGKVVRNKLEFFEIIWDNAGKAVELNVLRASNGNQWNESITIGKRAPDNLYKWQLPFTSVLATTYCSSTIT